MQEKIGKFHFNCILLNYFLHLLSRFIIKVVTLSCEKRAEALKRTAAQGLTGILIKLLLKTENAYALQWRAAPCEG